jgi:hypothetical protein
MEGKEGKYQACSARAKVSQNYGLVRRNARIR